MSNTQSSLINNDDFLMNQNHRDSGNSSNCSSDLDTTTEKSSIDLNILSDDRLIENLLFLEQNYRIHDNYFLGIQTDIKPWMRKTLAHWMLDVCRSQSIEDDIFVLAINILDRFLSIQQIFKRHLQLLGTACMFIASKLRSSIHFNAEILVIYTANSITLEELLSWEQFILHKLKWDVCGVTPIDYIPHFLKKLNLIESKHLAQLCQNVNNYISLCFTELKFSYSSPSIIASACIYSSVKSMQEFSNFNSGQILEELTLMTRIETGLLRGIIEQVDDLLMDNLSIRVNLVEIKLEKILIKSIQRHHFMDTKSTSNILSPVDTSRTRSSF